MIILKNKLCTYYSIQIEKNREKYLNNKIDAGEKLTFLSFDKDICIVRNYVRRVLSCPTCLTCLPAYVPYLFKCFACLHAFASYVPSFFFPCFRFLSALPAFIFLGVYVPSSFYVPYVPSSFYVPSLF